ncbi:Hypothetical protein GLP15_3940 [Giardia lamblia P15]|uniref:tRNA (guanine(9)-N(1))-methyltransferase n=1 Tax=Giardia intestinalis (strain P15) TaxID=658858 RepID=E1F2H1_GIAIA|nr:Hypothetical protein GLP15_3940 [Giardia lamblia P15]
MSCELSPGFNEPRKQGRAWKHIRQQLRLRLDSAPTILIDCSYDDLMKQGEIKSRNSQLVFCYSTSVRQDVECPLRLSVVGATNSLSDFLQRVQKEGSWSADITTRSLEDLIGTGELSVHKLVYLTADAEEEIDTYYSGDTYIIGGLVDRNRHNGITLRKARNIGIRTAKLPLHKCCNLVGSTVLSVNHIFAFMTYLHCGLPFKTVAKMVIPQRKLKAVENTDSGSRSDSQGC